VLPLRLTAPNLVSCRSLRQRCTNSVIGWRTGVLAAREEPALSWAGLRGNAVPRRDRSRLCAFAGMVILRNGALSLFGRLSALHPATSYTPSTAMPVCRVASSLGVRRAGDSHVSQP
jgi:hypothetical protein